MANLAFSQRIERATVGAIKVTDIINRSQDKIYFCLDFFGEDRFEICSPGFHHVEDGLSESLPNCALTRSKSAA